MKNLKYIILLTILLFSSKAFSQEIKEQKQDLYILFGKNDRNKFIKNDSTIYRNYTLYYSKFNDPKSIELKIDSNNNLEKIIWISGNTSTSPIINFYYLSNDITRNEREKVDIKKMKNLLEEDEIIKYVKFQNLKEILTKFNIYAVEKVGKKYYACKVQYAIW